MSKTKHAEHFDYVVDLLGSIIYHKGIRGTANLIGISRPTVHKYYKYPETMTLGFVFKLEEAYDLVQNEVNLIRQNSK